MRSGFRVCGLGLLAGMMACARFSLPATSGRSGAAIYHDCQLCHSTRELQRGPIIDGLPAWYTEGQLEKFIAGIRGGRPENRSEHLMGSATNLLHSARDIRRVAAHIASLPPPAHLRVIQGDPEKGRAVYAQCAPCHGLKGEGNQDAASPPLQTMEDWFLLDQLRKFKSGQRGVHPEDIGGQIMALTVQNLSDQDFKNVVVYITRLVE